MTVAVLEPHSSVGCEKGTRMGTEHIQLDVE